jgi:aryl-alcohol dehydrogenase-like predicted oxidoreductase
MTEAIRNLIKKGKREDLVIVDQVYRRGPFFIRRSFDRFFKKTGAEYADVFLLGWWNKTPKQKVLDLCAELKEKGLCRYLAISGHNRKAFPVFAETGLFDIIHVRYNAGHRGAESEVFPHMPAENRPGMVTYTATRWGSLLKPKKMPPGENTPTASDCYRFVLTNPAVDVCMTGPKNMEQMQHALTSLDKGPLSEDELAWMRRVGDHVHG